ncbi:MAG: FAD-binding oxidoreductase [Pseudomonadota bacterium]
MTDGPERFDVIVIGAGIAGAALACFASQHARVLLLERESQPGLHSTGRSAAMFMESYGPPQVRALTRASRGFFENPPPGFATTPLVRPRGALFIGSAAQVGQVEALYATLNADGCPAHLLDSAAARQRVPVLNASAAALAVLDPSAADVDVDALHQGFLRSARARGARLVCDAPVSAMSYEAHEWQVQCGTRRWRAPAIVNAAGAWVDEVARMAGVPGIGIEARRRSAFVFEPPPDLSSESWPCVAAVDESFYFKPDAGLLLGSPANADPVPPHDVVPEELDIALAIDRIEAATSLRIRRPRRSWAGLRCFIADGEIVCGPDPHHPGFFWAAALGGYGIQTSPALGALGAALVTRQALPAWLSGHGIDPQRMAARAARRTLPHTD